MSLATDGPLIEFRAVSKGFPGVRALKDVSLSIGRAEIHALVGENGAGKSTLMNILGGQYAPDRGEVLLRGVQVRLRNPAHARKMGIGIVYQETRLCPALTVTENIFLGRERVLGGGKIVWQKMRDEAARLLSSLAIPIDPDARVGRLSVADRQQVEVVRAISLDADAIVLDEPTSALSLTESERLFGKIRELRGRGISIIYISHRMEEVFSLADRISVLRDGQYLGTFPTRQTSPQAIVALIAGKELDREKRRAHPRGRPKEARIAGAQSRAQGPLQGSFLRGRRGRNTGNLRPARCRTDGTAGDTVRIGPQAGGPHRDWRTTRREPHAQARRFATASRC